ncbi:MULTISPECIES: C40 family peptidase [Bacillus]|uniref:C40 family peptidase n=1 Tax=Bacillus TaxID=1386 RepID=UPI0030F97E22
MRKYAIISVALALMLSVGSLFSVKEADAAYSPTAVVSIAKKYIGVPYKYGGTTPSGFDCSGFIYYTHKRVGKILPRTVAQLYKKGKFVSKSSLRPGDLIFFSTYKKGPSHVALYLGKQQFIHSASKGVRIDRLSNPYWKKAYIAAKRY